MSGSSKIYASGFGIPKSRGYRRAMGRIVATKIRNLRTVLGINQTELAERLGVTQASVSRWEKGSMPEADKLARLAEMAGESVRSFIEDTGNSNASSPQLNRFCVRGAVAAGVWAAAYEWPQEEWKTYSGGMHIDVPAESRFGLEVRGESMNQIYPPGTVLDCVSVFALGEVQTGQRVIVEQRNAGGEVEATVKEYVVGDDGSEWLVPRSNNPAFQAISANEPGEGIAEIRVIAIVVGSYRPE